MQDLASIHAAFRSSPWREETRIRRSASFAAPRGALVIQDLFHDRNHGTDSDMPPGVVSCLFVPLLLAKLV